MVHDMQPVQAGQKPNPPRARDGPGLAICTRLVGRRK